ILREAAGSKRGAVDVGRDVRERRVDAACLAVVQRGKRRSQSVVVSVGQIVADRAGRRPSKLLGSTQAVRSSPDDIHTAEHRIQQRRLSAGARDIESFLQAVVQKVRGVEIDTVVKLPAESSDVPAIEGEIAAHVSGYCESEVLN